MCLHVCIYKIKLIRNNNSTYISSQKPIVLVLFSLGLDGIAYQISEMLHHTIAIYIKKIEALSFKSLH